jgi:hypothetical protein
LVIIANAGQRHSKFNSKEAINTDLQPFLELTIGTSTEDILDNPIISLSNHPNPFNPSTIINFNLSNKLNEPCQLTIYNSRGQKIKTFPNLQINQSQNQQVVWDGRDDTFQSVASGIYLYQIKSGNFIKTNKMILMK